MLEAGTVDARTGSALRSHLDGVPYNYTLGHITDRPVDMIAKTSHLPGTQLAYLTTLFELALGRAAQYPDFW